MKKTETGAGCFIRSAAKPPNRVCLSSSSNRNWKQNEVEKKNIMLPFP